MKQIILFVFVFPCYLVLGQKGNPSFDIRGKYTHKTDYCKIDLDIYSEREIHKYRLKTSDREVRGKIEMREPEEDGQGYYFVLKDLNWDDCSGIMENGGYDKEKQKCPDVEGIIYPSGIIIQNLGNSMNYYEKIEECDDKYIQLNKL